MTVGGLVWWLEQAPRKATVHAGSILTDALTEVALLDIGSVTVLGEQGAPKKGAILDVHSHRAAVGVPDIGSHESGYV